MGIAIKDIKISENRRKIDENTVEMLMESFKDVGILHPIVIDYDYNLVAGAHRVEAAKRLGWTEIPFTAIDFSEENAKIAEDDENDVRTPNIITRAKWLLKRKERYENLHPETTREANLKQYRNEIKFVSDHKELLGEEEFAQENENCRNDEKVGSDNKEECGKIKTFVQIEAEKRGVSERAIEQEIQIAQNIEPEILNYVEEIGINKTNALNLARKTPEEQREIVEPIREAIQAVAPEERKQTANIMLGRGFSFTKNKSDVEINAANAIRLTYQSAIKKPADLEMKPENVRLFCEQIINYGAEKEYVEMIDTAVRKLQKIKEEFLNPKFIGGKLS